jgi:hypothetical protein
VEKIMAQKAQIARDALGSEGIEAQFTKDIEMDVKEMFRPAKSVLATAHCERSSDGQKAVGNAFHSRDHHNDTGVRRGFTDQARCVEHALSALQRTTAKFES